MPNNVAKPNEKLSQIAAGIVADLPWLQIAAGGWKLARKLWRGLADEGMYEVLEYESCLELLDSKGRRARFTKREKVRYLQNNILAYQDHAWGDGEILLDYRCTPGVVVDRYRPGQKTFLLISLRESKQKGDIDEFNIQWGIRDGFLREQELWETEIRHRTRRATVRIIFPKSRPPLRVWLEQNIRRKRQQLSSNLHSCQTAGGNNLAY
jgi:hypothetical protein